MDEEKLRKLRETVRESALPWKEGGDAVRVLRRLGAIQSRREMSRLQAKLTEDDLKGIEAFSTSGPCKSEPDCKACTLRTLCGYASKRLTLKDLPLSERPRERLLAEGPGALSNADLIAIILRSGNRAESAVQLAERLLRSFGGQLKELAEAGTAELKAAARSGLGDAKVAQLRAAFELARRIEASPATPPSLSSSCEVFQLMAPTFRDQKKETFWVLLLDIKNRCLKREKVSEGSLTASIVHPREVFRPAIRESAAAIICVHNHPSGDPSPSVEDIQITERLKETSKIVGIKLLDHIIIGGSRYKSLADEGLL